MIRTLLTLALVTSATTAQAGIFDIPPEEQTSFIDVGAALLARAAYVGSEDTETDIFPYLAGEYKGRIFGNPAQGVGVNLINDGTFTVSPIVSFAGGRDAEHTPFIFDPEDGDGAEGEVALTDDLDGLFEVDPSITAGGLVTWLFPYARADLQAMTPIAGGDVDGMRVDASLTTRIPIGPVFLAPGVRATWLSDEWTETYYGIDAAQAAALTQAGNGAFADGFDPDSSWTLGLQGIVFWEAIPDVNVIGAVNYSLLQDDAKDSPLSAQNDGLTAVLGVAKRF